MIVTPTIKNTLIKKIKITIFAIYIPKDTTLNINQNL